MRVQERAANEARGTGKMRKFTLLCAAAAIVAPAAAYAQETTSVIRGTVTNHGQPVPGASVTVVNTSNGSRAESTTGADGSFLFPGLQPGGPYTVQVASPQGNKTVTDIYTIVQQAYEVPVELGVTETGNATQGTGTATAAPADKLPRSVNGSSAKGQPARKAHCA